MTSLWEQVARIALWTFSLTFGVWAFFYLGPIVYFTDVPSDCLKILGLLFKDLNILTWVYLTCRNWFVALFSSLLALLLLCSTSKCSVKRRWQALGLLSVVAAVFICHVYFSLSPPPQYLWAYLTINPMPMVWVLLSVVSVYFVGCLALVGWVWKAYNRVVQRWNSRRIQRYGSSAQTSLVHYFIEFFGTCFWVLYLYTMHLGMTSGEWNQWNGWPPVVASYILLMFILLVFGFGEILGLSLAGKPITLKRFHSLWTLSPAMIVAFVLAMQVRLGTFDQQVLFWAGIFSYSLSLGSALAVLAVREPLLDAVKRKHWYTSMKVEEREGN